MRPQRPADNFDREWAASVIDAIKAPRAKGSSGMLFSWIEIDEAILPALLRALAETGE